MNKKQFTIIDYTDVTEDMDGFYVVNDSQTFGSVAIEDNATESEIIRTLKKARYLNAHASVRSVIIDWMDETWAELSLTNGMPVGRLVADAEGEAK